MNLLIARFTKINYVFLTGHHSLFMACLMSAVLGTAGLSGIELILVGGFLMGAWSAISPAIGQSYTSKVTDGDEIALGHFGSLRQKKVQKILRFLKNGASCVTPRYLRH